MYPQEFQILPPIDGLWLVVNIQGAVNSMDGYGRAGGDRLPGKFTQGPYFVDKIKSWLPLFGKLGEFPCPISNIKSVFEEMLLPAGKSR